jgi:hypothetical protein
VGHPDGSNRQDEIIQWLVVEYTGHAPSRSPAAVLYLHERPEPIGTDIDEKNCVRRSVSRSLSAKLTAVPADLYGEHR